MHFTLNTDGSFTITELNIEEIDGNFNIIPKEVKQKAYLEKVGKEINFCGVKKTVKNVRITDEFIFIDLV